MTGAAKKTTLAQFSLTEVAEGPGENTTQVDLPSEGGGTFTYYTAPVVDLTTGKRRDGKPKWAPDTFPLYPVVLNADGSPWAEANLWMVDMLEGKVDPNMLTYATIADDLAAFRRYLDDEQVDWLNFSSHKLRRPTYRYNGFLKLAVETAEISPGLAKRRMGTIVRFYRWLMTEALFKPGHAPWVESDRFIEWKDERGFSGVLAVTTTDVSLKDKSAIAAWDEDIQDGGRLRPLPRVEQEVLLQVLADIGNTEMTLIHLVSLFSGARIQTVLTIKTRDVALNPKEIAGDDFCLKAGPGTGIDTKNGTRGTLHMPKWLYERLYIYSHSQRAKSRRGRALGGDHPDQPLFLSNRGAPLYEARPRRGHAGRLGPHVLRHAKTGQAVRQFIKERLLPEMRWRLNNPRYSFSFHDLRATFGLNTVDSMRDRIEAKSMTYTHALDQLRHLMWHSRLEITEKYLKYRETLALFDAVQDEWNGNLATLALRATESEVPDASPV
jgi:hypothetical protein